MNCASKQLPLVAELPSAIRPSAVFRRFRHRPHCVFLDSSLKHPSLARYSFLACDPFEVLQDSPGESPDGSLPERVSRWKHESIPRDDLPPFQGGLAGVFTYECGHTFEQIPDEVLDEFQFRAGCFAAYDVVVAFDHVADKAWLISQGFPETDGERRLARAASRLELFQTWIREQESPAPVHAILNKVEIETPMVAMDTHAGLFSNFDSASYLAMVARVIEYIRAGDIFQANVAQRLLAEAKVHASELYLRLRQTAPATFAGYFDAGRWQVVSASPERFVQIQNGMIESRPIKGTRRQTQQPIADLYAAADLHASDKDNAENVMIVDLIRNDLSRICLEDSLQVTQMCGLETYGYVQHLVSAVCGGLRPDSRLYDVLQATFPGGSITGAPKIRAMQIITELEQVARGPYCGSLGYVNWTGDVDLNILIRTITASGGWWQMPVGGGVVVDSNPQSEYEETWHKAAGLLAAVHQAQVLD